MPYQAPTSSAFGGTLGTPPKPPAGASAPATIPPPPSPGSAADSSHVDPFFRPEDLITQNNFWAQWNGTFADLDQRLGDLQRNTTFERAQLADSHKSNVSGINDNSAARGLSHSSIRDGSQAQEQTQFTRNDQNLQDALNSFATYVQGQKDTFNTNVLPGFNSAESGQAVQNAQDVNNAYVPPPMVAPTGTVTQSAQTSTPVKSPQTAQFTAAHPVVKHALKMQKHAIGLLKGTNQVIGSFR